MGLWCCFSFVCLSFFFIINMYLLGNVCIRLRFNLWIVWYCCFVRIVSKVVNFSESCFRFSEVIGVRVCRFESIFLIF